MWCVWSTKHDKTLAWKRDAVVLKSTLQHGMIVATRSGYKLRLSGWVSVFYQHLVSTCTLNNNEQRGDHVCGIFREIYAAAIDELRLACLVHGMI
jgi:hypothetical protein